MPTSTTAPLPSSWSAGPASSCHEPPTPRALVRTAGVLGAVTQLLVGLMNIGMFPAAFVAGLAAVAGTRQVGRDLEAASIRFGVALLASGVGVVLGLASGVLAMMAAAVLSAACLSLAWTGVQQLARAHRASFGIRHLDWTRRDTELHARRDALRDRRAGERAVAADPAEMADDQDADTWWEDLD